MSIKLSSFIASWVITCVVALTFSSFCGNLFMASLFVFGSSPDDTNKYYVAGIFGLITGCSVGVMQILSGEKLLIERIKFPWVIISAIGAIISFLLVTLIFSITKQLEYKLPYSLLAAFASGVVSGLFVGLLQWLLLRKTYRTAAWWILVNCIAGIAMCSIRWAWIPALENMLGDCSFSLSFNVLFLDGALSVAAGTVFGVITGLSLFYISWSTVDFAVEVTPVE